MTLVELTELEEGILSVLAYAKDLDAKHFHKIFPGRTNEEFLAAIEKLNTLNLLEPNYNKH